MDKMIKINNNEVSIKEYKGQRVVTFKDIDTVHQRPSGTAGRNFRYNQRHLIENEDYFIVTRHSSIDEFRPLGTIPPKGLILLTETGYLMLVKSFTDDLAWTVQRELVNNYFNTRKAKIETQEQPYEFVMKYYNNEPVVTVKDIEHKTGISGMVLRWYVKKLILNKDYFVLEGEKLNEFKVQNPKVSTKFISSLIIINEAGFIKLAKLIKQPKNCIEFKKKENPKDTDNSVWRVDIPKNTAIQNQMNNVMQTLTTLKTMVSLYNRYFTVEDKEHHAKVLQSIGYAVANEVYDLVHMPVNLIKD